MSAPTEADIEARVRSVQARLGLTRWDIRVHVGRVQDDVPDKRLSGASVAYPEYMTADVFFDPEQIVFSHENLDDLVHHEMMHVMLSPLVSVADFLANNDPARDKMVRDAHELVTTMLERMPLWDTQNPLNS